MPDGTMSEREVSQAIGRLESAVSHLDEKVDHLPDRMHERYVPREVAAAQHDAINSEIKTATTQIEELKSWQKWVGRLVVTTAFSAIGALLLAVATLILTLMGD